MTQDKDPKIAQAGVASAVYWMGRVNGETPNADIERIMTRLSATLTPQMIAGDATRCSNEMKVRGNEMQRAGAAIKRKGAAQAK